MAKGKSTVHGIAHITRGYENLEMSLRSLGANMEVQ
jgi:UDP-N-acetylglucosamine enolpyruvyl transferase